MVLQTTSKTTVSGNTRTVPKVHNEYDPPVDLGIDCSGDDPITIQSAAAECDINNIMAKFEATGLMEFKYDMTDGKYADLANVGTYHYAQTVMVQAQQAFDALPSKIRTKFHNDPGEFLSFVHNPNNQQALIDLGLAVDLRTEPSSQDIAGGQPGPLGPPKGPGPGDPPAA